MALDQEQIRKALEAGKIVLEFASYVSILGQLLENSMFKEVDKYKESPSEIYIDAYYSTIYFCSDTEVKIKALILLGIENEEWIPELDQKSLKIHFNS